MFLPKIGNVWACGEFGSDYFNITKAELKQK